MNDKEGDAQGYKNASTLFFVKAISKLGKTLQELNEEKINNTLIHNHGIWLPLNHYASVTAQRLNIPLIISPRGMLEPWARSYRGWKKALAWHFYQRRDLKAASVLHATSEQEAKNLQSLGLRIPVAIIPNGVSVPEFTEPEVKDINKKRLFFYHVFIPKKDLLTLFGPGQKIDQRVGR